MVCLRISLTSLPGRRFWLALGLLIMCGGFGLTGSVLPAKADALAVTPRGAGRHYYLTSQTYATNQVKTACAVGYHMASMWEILDVTNLTYDINQSAAYKRDDSGYGPPSDWNGWVRTGVASSGENTIGTGNCKNWTSVAGTDYGVSVRLSRFWESAPGDLLAWDATNYTCNYVGPVWCARDVLEVYLPIVKR